MRGHGQANLTVLSLFVSDLESTSHCLQGGRLRARLGRDCDKGYKGSFGEACLTGLTLPCVVPATQAQDTCTIHSTARTNASPEGRGAAHRNDILRRLIQKTWFRICSSKQAKTGARSHESELAEAEWWGHWVGWGHHSITQLS